MSDQLDNMRKAYDKWAPIYDLVYDGLTAPARRTAVRAALSNGRRILEVGVGTGLSLRNYPRETEIYGVDLSYGMLLRAREDRAAAVAARQADRGDGCLSARFCR